MPRRGNFAGTRAVPPNVTHQHPEQDEAGIALILSGACAILLAGAFLVFGSPSQPGERRKALFAMLEDILGYHTLFGLFLGIGVLMLGYGLWERRRAQRP
jgi:hypothetical protein